MTDNANTGKKLVGNLHLGILTDTYGFSGYRDRANVTQFTYNPGSSTVGEHLGAGTDNEGQRLGAWTNPQPPMITFTLDSLPADQLSTAMRGALGVLSQGSGSAVDEPLTLYQDSWVRMPHRNITEAGFALTGTGGTPTHVLGTDYEVDYVHGLIKALTVAAAGAQEADYDYAAVTGIEIGANATSEFKAALLLTGKNKVSGKKAELEMTRGLLLVASELQLIGGEQVVSMQATAYPELAPGASASVNYREW